MCTGVIERKRLDPGPFPELGKADTRSGKGPDQAACDAAPERVRGQARERRTAQVTGNELPGNRNKPPAIATRLPRSESGALSSVPCGSGPRACDVVGPATCAVRCFRAAPKTSSGAAIAGGRSGAFPRARVCLSSSGKEHRIARLPRRPRSFPGARKLSRACRRRRSPAASARCRAGAAARSSWPDRQSSPASAPPSPRCGRWRT